MCWHKWTKWEQYIVEGTCQSHPFSKHVVSFSEERQRRHCEKCLKKQVKRVDSH